MNQYLHHWLTENFPEQGEWLYIAAIVTIIAITSLVLHVLLHTILLRFLSRFTQDANGTLRQAFFKFHVVGRLVLIAQGAILYTQARIWLPRSSEAFTIITTLSELWFLLFTTLFVFAVLNSIEYVSSNRDLARRLPIRGIFQGVKLLSSVLVIIFSISILIDKSPLMLLSGLGAMTAILSLVFKDSILGFVAGIQLSANRMLQVGDWLEMPKYGADGDVIEINLNTVKVRNFDKTITTIPAYTLITDSFKNWRGMEESGGRRIKRSFFIDATSVKFLTNDDIDRLRRTALLTDYIEAKVTEINTENSSSQCDLNSTANGRRLTNLGTFRAYLTAYLHSHKEIHSNMTRMVRQLQPDEKGIPLEIYAFTNNIQWVEYERIQSDVFDHIFAVVAEFDLRIYQAPTGHDMQKIASQVAYLTLEKTPNSTI